MSNHVLAGTAKHAAERAATNPAIEFLERAGYVARGVVYAVMGALALALAFGVGGKATDPTGTIVTLTAAPFGRFLLLAVGICLAAYALWGFVRAIFDPLRRGKDAPGIVERLGFVWSGISYSALALFSLQLFAGAGSGASSDSTQSTITRVLAYPAGKWVATAIGVVAIAVGIYQFVMAYRADFKKDLKREEMTPTELQLVEGLGRIGFIARGAVFTLVGWFVVQGGLHRDPNRVHGYSGAFLFLLAQPYGHLLLGIVAAGFVALGFHSFACARWIRLMGSRA
ncbi:MAG TPA: DUF1206 domain-containing protein [Candidatus Dormibacteraeota bacterium]|nr:DUF1206 domain-containing protein [Candidatus Dormibacteraeota bacterium]